MLLEAPTSPRRGFSPIDGYSLREMEPVDIEELGHLYFAAYDPGVASATLDEAIADIQASFDGEYGKLWLAASPVATRGGTIVAAAMTVHRAPWEDAGDCPFIIELFTHPEHRRLGLARWLMLEVLASVGVGGERCVQLRVSDENSAALELYRSLGFAEA